MMDPVSDSSIHNPWRLGGLTVRELARRVWDDMQKVELMGRAAQLAFYFLLALFPALLFFTALVGLFPLESSVPELLNYLRYVLPGDALSLVKKTIQQVVQGSGESLLSLGLLGALWASSSGMTAMMDALNAIYKAPETRPLWKVRAIAIATTVGLAGFILISTTLVLSGEHLADWVAAVFGFGGAFTVLWTVLKWPLVCAFMFLVVAVIYYVAPDVKQNWYWVTPGSTVAVVLWLIVSLGFKLYVEYLGDYNAVYGSIAGVIVLMMWLYLNGVVLLLGGEINAAIGKAAATLVEVRSKRGPVLRRVMATDRREDRTAG